MASHPVVPDAQHADAHAHPSQGTYIKIAAILAMITGLEVLIYYIEALEGVLVPLLIALSVVKFVMVVGYFMHLRFDNRMLAFIFTAAMVVSLAVYIGTWLLTNNDPVSQFIKDTSL